MARDGVKGLFKGFLPNVVKNMPNKTIQLTAFDIFKVGWCRLPLSNLC